MINIDEIQVGAYLQFVDDNKENKLRFCKVVRKGLDKKGDPIVSVEFEHGTVAFHAEAFERIRVNELLLSFVVVCHALWEREDGVFIQKNKNGVWQVFRKRNNRRVAPVYSFKYFDELQAYYRRLMYPDELCYHYKLNDANNYYLHKSGVTQPYQQY